MFESSLLINCYTSIYLFIYLLHVYIKVTSQRQKTAHAAAGFDASAANRQHASVGQYTVYHTNIMAVYDNIFMPEAPEA